MATPIKDTPVLTGKDARRFEAWMKGNEGEKVSPEEYARIKDAGKKMRVFNSMEDYERYCSGCSTPSM